MSLSEWADTLWAWLSERRWFASKGRGGGVVDIQSLGTMSDQGTVVECEIVTVELADGAHEYYQLLTTTRPEPGEGLIGERAGVGLVHDATFDPAAMRLVLRALAGDGSPAGWRVRLTAEALDATLPTRVYGGEQSNTNVIVGDRAIVKLFRKVEMGRNLDVETHAALGEAGVTSVAHLFGWVEGDVRTADGQSHDTDLAMIVELLPTAQDGFVLACDQAQRGVSFADDAAALARALGDVHRALSEQFGIDSIDGTRLADTMKRRLAAAIEVAPALTEYQDALASVFDRLVGRTVSTQRIHGDFHLGQTLKTARGWALIDFEGEPMKSMAERREPDSPLRDVAGMLRSIGYAAASGGLKPASQWEAEARAAFLGGADRATDQVILDAYEADKAIYEVIYETRNRPDWVTIPLAAIARLATGR